MGLGRLRGTTACKLRSDAILCRHCWRPSAGVLVFQEQMLAAIMIYNATRSVTSALGMSFSNRCDAVPSLAHETGVNIWLLLLLLLLRGSVSMLHPDDEISVVVLSLEDHAGQKTMTFHWSNLGRNTNISLSQRLMSAANRKAGEKEKEPIVFEFVRGAEGLEGGGERHGRPRRRTSVLALEPPCAPRPAPGLVMFSHHRLSGCRRMPLSLDCTAFFGYSGENRRPIIYWTRGEKFVEELAGHIKESEVRLLKEYLGEKEVQLSLTFDAEAVNGVAETSTSGEQQLQLSVFYMYRLELAGGLGVILLLLGVLTAVYKCYSLEMLLCYRRHFGSDETEDDNKEYDAYLTYTKVDLDSMGRASSDEETLASEILPDVLEKHYGYKLFIPDRDLIPSSSTPCPPKRRAGT
ncbi:hypothetical protein CRUP_024943 [Coryphaenoides rupestris]|nr:hypothetical protein CRUP_024943 [Coryphaenoides rupestris]